MGRQGLPLPTDSYLSFVKGRKQKSYRQEALDETWGPHGASVSQVTK